MFKFIKSRILQFVDVYCREFKLVLHDPGILLFIIFLPFAYPIIYSLIYNPELVRDVKMVVVDNDRTSESRDLLRKFDATEYAWVTGYAADMGEARRAMDSHNCYAILEIPEGYARNIGRGEQANAVVYCESSLLLRYRGFLMASTALSEELGNEIRIEKIDEVAPLAATVTDGDLIPIESVQMGNTESGFDSFIMPGVIILILHQCIILATGMAGGAKRERPELIGYNGVNEMPSVLMTMFGQMLCYFTLLLIPSFFLIHYVPLIFSFPMAGNVWEEFMFLTPMAFACLAIGFCFQGIVWERESVFVLWVITSLAFLFLSGLTWPRYAMSPLWYWLGNLVPATWGVEGFIRMNSNGASLSQVSNDYIALWILAVAYMALAYCVQRWIVRPSEINRDRMYKKVRAESI